VCNCQNAVGRTSAAAGMHEGSSRASAAAAAVCEWFGYLSPGGVDVCSFVAVINPRARRPDCSADLTTVQCA